MKQAFQILIFVGAIGLGALADRWVLSPQSSSRAVEFPSDSDAALTSVTMPHGPEAELVTGRSVTAAASGTLGGRADNEILLASFDEFADISHSATTEIASRERPSLEASRKQVRTLIEERFPGLSHEAVAGWTDAYENVPLDELHLLLEQRKGLPSILPRNSYLSNVPSEIGELRTTPVTEQGPFDVAAMIVRENLVQADTPGYRRRRIVTHPESFSSSADSLNGLQPREVFDLQPGKVHPCQQPFYMAIADNPELMFQLEPGDLLTRSGTFVRLPDGRLGIQNKDGAVALSAQITIPEDTGAIQVSTSGTVSFSDAVGELQPAGELKLAIVTELVDFHSANGVFFTTSTDPSMVPMADRTPVVTSALESSNVDIEYEWKLADHYERLSRQ
ncbi:MAG: hypothetical protein GY903_19520 [Fuerstiella sp.]|nr:hypothetical protein [Fuerstiella sp.]MCP4856676.1 hypothetical protein [Fuerstiella sp.]